MDFNEGMGDNADVKPTIQQQQQQPQQSSQQLHQHQQQSQYASNPTSNVPLSMRLNSAPNDVYYPNSSQENQQQVDASAMGGHGGTTAGNAAMLGFHSATDGGHGSADGGHGWTPAASNTANALTVTVSGQTTALPIVPAQSYGHTYACQVEGCQADLHGVKEYYKRHRVCDMHSKASSVMHHGIIQRFCQQCSKFHLLDEFDEGKRSCRRRLLGHNKRRRKSHQKAQAEAAAAAAAAAIAGTPPPAFDGAIVVHPATSLASAILQTYPQEQQNDSHSLALSPNKRVKHEPGSAAVASSSPAFSLPSATALAGPQTQSPFAQPSPSSMISEIQKSNYAIQSLLSKLPQQDQSQPLQLQQAPSAQQQQQLGGNINPPLSYDSVLGSNPGLANPQELNFTNLSGALEYGSNSRAPGIDIGGLLQQQQSYAHNNNQPQQQLTFNSAEFNSSGSVQQQHQQQQQQFNIQQQYQSNAQLAQQQQYNAQQAQQQQYNAQQAQQHPGGQFPTQSLPPQQQQQYQPDQPSQQQQQSYQAQQSVQQLQPYNSSNSNQQQQYNDAQQQQQYQQHTPQAQQQFSPLHSQSAQQPNYQVQQSQQSQQLTYQQHSQQQAQLQNYPSQQAQQYNPQQQYQQQSQQQQNYGATVGANILRSGGSGGSGGALLNMNQVLSVGSDSLSPNTSNFLDGSSFRGEQQRGANTGSGLSPFSQLGYNSMNQLMQQNSGGNQQRQISAADVSIGLDSLANTSSGIASSGLSPEMEIALQQYLMQQMGGAGGAGQHA